MSLHQHLQILPFQITVSSVLFLYSITIHLQINSVSSFSGFVPFRSTNVHSLHSRRLGTILKKHQRTVQDAKPSTSRNSPSFEIINEALQFSSQSQVIHVGNLDWTVPSREVSNMLLEAVSGGVNGDVQDVNIWIKPKSGKRRDLNKFHGGSAKLIFRSKEEAEVGMERLMQLVVEGHKFKVQWAADSFRINGHDHGGSSNINDSSGKNIQQKRQISPELVDHRKRRAEQYARRRRNIAQKTDRIIESLFLPENNPVNDIASQRIRSLKTDNDVLNIDVPILDAPVLDWSIMPKEVDPVRGGGIRKGTARGDRKHAQVEAFFHVLKEALLDDSMHGNCRPVDETNVEGQVQTKQMRQRFVADLGSGAGNLSLPLAWWLSKNHLNCGVVAVDINRFALDRLSTRAKASGVPLQIMEEDLLHLIAPSHKQDEGYYVEGNGKESSFTSEIKGNPSNQSIIADCSAVISLHACGAASDLAMSVAVSHGLSFAISPCCIGKQKYSRRAGRMPSISTERSSAPNEISYPRSDWLNEAVNLEEYKLLASAADYGVGSSAPGNTAGPNFDSLEIARRTRCRLAKRVVEMDRLQWAKERGYHVRMLELPRIGPLYPKREILLGAKRGTQIASRISHLSTSTRLYGKLNEEDDDIIIQSENKETINKFDGKGLAGYLAPYALALFLSLAVTGAFLKFVLLDY